MPDNSALGRSPSIDLPLRFFLLGLSSLFLFAGALPFFAGEVLGQYHYSPHAVAFTHLLTLGWITPIIMGAMIQLAPAALGGTLFSERLVHWNFWLYLVGLAGMLTGFWLWNFKILIWFGTPLTAGLSLFIYNMARSLRMAPVRDVVTLHIATALAYLVLTFLAGQYLIHARIIPWSFFNVLPSVHAHAHLAALGWFGMMIIGVSYRLLPMFLLSTIQSPLRIRASHGFLNAGIVGVFMGILKEASWVAWAAGLAGIGLFLWTWEMAAIYRARKRPSLDVPMRQAAWAIGQVPLLAVFGLWLSWPGGGDSFRRIQAQTGYGWIALMGWTTLLIMAMLYKIIPFLVWIRCYAREVGRRTVPQLHHLYSVPLQRISFGLYVAGVWLTGGLCCFGDRIPSWILQASASLMGVGILLFSANMLCCLRHLMKWTKEWGTKNPESSRSSCQNNAF